LFAVNILDLNGQKCSLIGCLDDGFYYSAFYSHLFLHEVPTKTGNIKHQCITLFLNINHKGPRPRSCSISPFPQSLFPVNSIGKIRVPKQSGPEECIWLPQIKESGCCLPEGRHSSSVLWVVAGCPGIYPHVFSWALVITFRHVCNSWKGRSAVPRRRSESGRLPWFGPVLTMSAIGSRFGLAGENLPYFRSVACFRFCDGRCTCFILSVLFEVVMRAS
jgi:hypothetical protein